MTVPETIGVDYSEATIFLERTEIRYYRVWSQSPVRVRTVQSKQIAQQRLRR